ncbi:hypothetical protein MRX96_040147 [Rhipicephalus microplus]
MGGAPFLARSFLRDGLGGCEMCTATERLLKTAKKSLQESRNGQKNNKVWQPTAENNKISVNKNNKNKDQGQDYNRNVARRKAKHTVSCTMGKGQGTDMRTVRRRQVHREALRDGRLRHILVRCAGSRQSKHDHTVLCVLKCA